MTTNTPVTNLKIVKKLVCIPSKFRETDYADKACFSYGYTKYGAFDNWGAAIKVLNMLPFNENVCNELILAPAKVKPYFDIEWMKDEFPELDHESVRKDLKTLLVEILHDDFSYRLNANDIYFSSCHRNKNSRYKYSYHVVISTHPSIVFLNANQAGYLANKLREKCSAFFDPSIVDTSVYKKTQNIRLVGHSKVDEFIPFEEERGTNIMEYLITNIEINHIILKSCEQSDSLYKSIKNVKKKNDDLTEDSIKEIRKYVKKFHPTADDGIEDGKGFIQFNYSDRLERCFCHERDEIYHDQIGFFAYIYGNIIHIGCHSGNCVDQKNKKIIKVAGTIESNKELFFEKVDFSNKFNINFNIIRDCLHRGAIGMSNLFKVMYLSPKRIKWINEGQHGTSFFWNGKMWDHDDYSYLERLLVVTIVNVLEDFQVSCKNEDMQADEIESVFKLSQKMAGKLNDGNVINNVLRFIKPLIRDTEFAEKKDIHPHFLSVKNGMVNLITGESRPAVPDDNVTRCIPTEYHEDADSSDFDNFVREITASACGFNEEIYEHLKWVLGYSMQGNPKKKSFIILYGPHGFNGKSMLLNTISDVLKEYAVTMDKSVVLEGGKKTAGSHSTELCQLEHARFGILSDTKEGEVIDDGQIKQLTGITDKLSIREIFGKQKEFKPVFVPFISTNHVIQVNLSDRAMYERLTIFPFVLSFVDSPTKSYERQNDNSLSEKLMKNKKGVLKWLVDASVFYNENPDKLAPECLNKAKDDYNKLVNPYIDFIEKYIVYEENGKVKVSDILQLYKEYCKENAMRFVSKSVELELNTHLIPAKLKSIKYYLKINIKDDENSDNEDDLDL